MEQITGMNMDILFSDAAAAASFGGQIGQDIVANAFDPSSRRNAPPPNGIPYDNRPGDAWDRRQARYGYGYGSGDGYDGYDNRNYPGISNPSYGK